LLKDDESPTAEAIIECANTAYTLGQGIYGAVQSQDIESQLSGVFQASAPGGISLRSPTARYCPLPNRCSYPRFSAGAQRESNSRSPESIRAVIVRSALLACGMPAWTYPEVTCWLSR
jgi:hypothetical protein